MSESCQVSAYCYYDNHYYLLSSKRDSSLLLGAFISGEAFRKKLGGISSRRRVARVLFRAWRGDDFEDEVYFKWGRVVTPRFSDIKNINLIFNVIS